MPRYSDTQIREALIATKGMVYLASKRLGCDPTVVRYRVAKSTALQEVIESASGESVDEAELKLLQAMRAGDPWAIQMMLKTKGKSRGYVERVEQTGADGGPIQTEDVSARDRIDSKLDELAERRRARAGAREPREQSG